MTKVLHQYVGPLPDITRVYPTDLALPTDRDWLESNPEAVARVRTFRDDTRTDQRVTLLTLRMLDPSGTDGWRHVYVEAHAGHWNGPAFKAWRDRPGDMMAANDLALTLLTADADTEGGHAMTALGGLALPDLSELSPHWQAQFAPVASRPVAQPHC